MSDLHCPARVLVVVPIGEHPEPALVEQARAERVVRVHARPESQAYAAVLADALGVPLEVETDPDLDALADGYLGEAFVMVTDRGRPGHRLLSRDTTGWREV